MRKLLGATLLSVALVVGVAGAPAQAAKSTTVTDNPNDAHRGIDMRTVKIKQGQGAMLKVRTVFSHMGRNLNGMQYYFDTEEGPQGPGVRRGLLPRQGRRPADRRARLPDEELDASPARS